MPITVASFGRIRQAISQVKREQLVLYYVADKKISEEELKNFLAESLPDYMMSSVFMAFKEMPLTPNGKINLKALPELNFSARNIEYEPPQTLLEKKLCSAFEKVLGLKENSVGRNDDFFSIGGDSLKSMLVMTNAGIEQFGAKDIFRYRTARRIAEETILRKAGDIQAYEMNARKKKLPITVEQTVMIDYQFLKPKATMFNLAFFYRFDSVDANRLEVAVEQVVRNHPALATNFELDIA